MFFAVQKYQRVPREEGDKFPSTKHRSKMLFQASFFRFALAFILGSCFGLAVMSLLLTKGLSQKPTAPSVIPAQVFSPKIPTIWVPDDQYIGWSNHTNIMWHRLIQPTDTVWISNPSDHGLGDGFEAVFDHHSKEKLTPQFYHISNLHQLHCLNIIRGRYFELRYDTPSLSKVSKLAADDTAYHIDHCIEYLRMTIMCGQSWDVESNSPAGTPHELKINPFGHPIWWGGVRNCVNWEALVTWQKKQLDAYKETWSS